ncbi:MAG: hypothetical protein ACRYGK_05305 [Janthinobacterium lividum]
MGVLQIHRPDGKAVFLQAGCIESFVSNPLNAAHCDITMSSQSIFQCTEPASVVARLIEISSKPGYAYAEKLIGTTEWVCENRQFETNP